MINNEMIKCGIKNNCINKSVDYYLKLDKIMKKIIKNLNPSTLRKITNKQLSDLKISYKEFSNIFFNKKTINCMKNFCQPKLTSYRKTKKNIDMMKSIIITTKNKIQKIDINKNYIKLMDLIYSILDHFCKNYQKYFEKIL
jgi:hypothetical protein